MIAIKPLRKRDVHKAIAFADTGMHFNWYLNSRFLRRLYGRYFWYLERSCATHEFAAYINGRFAGVLLAELYGAPTLPASRPERVYVHAFERLMEPFFKGGTDVYAQATKMMLRQYRQQTPPDGEIVFLAADPASKERGIGTALLAALEKAAPGRTIFLQTDSACSWQFYEHRGFERAQETHIVLELPKGKVPLECYLYSKTLAGKKV